MAAPTMNDNMTGVSCAGPKLPSAELVARVLQPNVVANIIRYATADEFDQEVYDKPELCRLLKVSQAFYHEAVRLLYRSIIIRFNHDSGHGVPPVLIDHGNKKNSLAYTHRLEIHGHKKASCAALASEDDSDVLPFTMPNLKTLQFNAPFGPNDRDEDCDAEDCPLTRGLGPTGELTFFIPITDYLLSSTINNFKAAITRLSAAATSVTIDCGMAGPGWLHLFLATPLGPNVAKLTFAFVIHSYREQLSELSFIMACEVLVDCLQKHRIDNITSVNFQIHRVRNWGYHHS